MKVLLVYPETPSTFWSFKEALKFVSKKSAEPPLGLITIASILPEEWEKKLIDLNEEDCLVMFSFPRYSEINYSILELAKKRGSKIILITDRVTSPLVPYADYLLTVKIDGVGFTNSYVVPLCVAESLAILIGQKIGTDSKQWLADLDFYISKNNLY